MSIRIGSVTLGVAAAAWIAAVACSSSSPHGNLCTVGAVVSCGCPGAGMTGTQTCLADGTLGSCSCAPPNQDGGLADTSAPSQDTGALPTDSAVDSSAMMPDSQTDSATATPDSAMTCVSDTACASGYYCNSGACIAGPPPNLDWDEWPVPNSQSDVTNGAPNLASYTDNGNGTVTDNVTGLEWQQAFSTGTFTQAGAAANCASLMLAGDSNWRLPSLIELVSIVDFDSLLNNSTYFPGMAANGFWSSTVPAGSTSNASFIANEIGITLSDSVTGLHNVRCVR